MVLQEFIKTFICPNTIVRVWKSNFEGGHEVVVDACMEWELLGLSRNSSTVPSRFKDKEVIGVTDIITDTYQEAVNIVIKLEGADYEKGSC